MARSSGSDLGRREGLLLERLQAEDRGRAGRRSGARAPTILGMDQNTVLIGGAALLGVGLLIAIIAGRKSAAPATAPARKK